MIGMEDVNKEFLNVYLEFMKKEGIIEMNNV